MALPARDATGPLLEIRILGPFEVSVNGSTIPRDRWQRRRPTLLVKLLALAPRHQMHREQLVDALWPDLAPESAARQLSKSLHLARRALEPGGESSFLHTPERHVTLGPPDRVWIDAEEFERSAAEGIRLRDVALCEHALSLYRGDLLVEELYEDWAQPARDRLRSLHESLLTTLANLHAVRGRADRGVELLERLLATDPACEPAHRHLMLLYARLGRQHQALRQYDLCRRALRTELDADPDRETEALYAQILSGEVEVTAGHTPPGNLPLPMTTFVGRVRELAEVERLLATSRLLTLTGMAGIGKTRLALEAASGAADLYPDGMWLVELAGLSEPALVARTVADAAGVAYQAPETPETALRDAFRARRALLLLDNCEHLVEACARLATDLVRSCPDLHILATSRETLGVLGERAWQVPPLAVPESGAPSRSESEELFLDRVALSDAPSPSDAAAPLVAEICRRLDGIPLAIELAAARARVLSLEQILSGLDDRFRMLAGGDRAAPPRHRTLEAALDWSYRLLSPAERALCRRLSVFAGGATIEAAEAALSVECSVLSAESSERSPTQHSALSTPHSLLDLLSSLAGKSMVIVDRRGAEARYWQLETIRRYGAERLEEAGEAERTRAAHGDWYLRFAERVEEEAVGPDRTAGLARLDAEHANLRAALDWSVSDDGDAEAGLRFGVALKRLWIVRGYAAEGLPLVERALELSAGRELPNGLRTRALDACGALLLETGEHARAARVFEEGLALLRADGDRPAVAAALRSLACTAEYMDDCDRAVACIAESRAISEELGDRRGACLALHDLGVVAVYRRDYDSARRLFEESLAGFESLDDAEGTIVALLNLGVVAFERGDLRETEAYARRGLAIARGMGFARMVAAATVLRGHAATATGAYDRAIDLHSEALRSLRDLGAKRIIVLALEGLGHAAAGCGDARLALRLIGAAGRAREQIRYPLTPVDVMPRERAMARACAALGAEGMERALAEGRLMPLEQAVASALQPLCRPHRVKTA